MSGPAEFAFVIQPPFWKTWWFRGFLSLVVVGVIIMALRIYTARKLKKQLALLERQQMIERERTRISQDMHDTIGSNMTRISILSDRVGSEIQLRPVTEGKADDIAQKAELIGGTAREVIDMMNEIIWSLDPKDDTLESLISYMRQFLNIMLNSTDMRCVLVATEVIPDIRLSPDFRRNIFLIFKEVVNNIVKHSHATTVEVNIAVTEHSLAFDIKDNGIGMHHSGYAGRRTGVGMRSIRERAASIGASLDIESIPQRGTTVRFCAELRAIPPI